MCRSQAGRTIASYHCIALFVLLFAAVLHTIRQWKLKYFLHAADMLRKASDFLAKLVTPPFTILCVMKKLMSG